MPQNSVGASTCGVSVDTILNHACAQAHLVTARLDTSTCELLEVRNAKVRNTNVPTHTYTVSSLRCTCMKVRMRARTNARTAVREVAKSHGRTVAWSHDRTGANMHGPMDERAHGQRDACT